MDAKHPTKPLGIVDLLELYGFDKSKRTNFARHKDRRFDDELHLRHWLDFYQATQGKPVFDRCEQIVAFVGSEKTKARFVGVYKLLGPGRDAHGIRPPKGYPPALSKYRYFYDLERQPGYERLENRVIVEWGSGTRLFHHWYNRKGKEPKDKEVLELLPGGQTRPPFRDYLGFTLTHTELKELYYNENANREWRSRLAAVAGVYLVLATKTGQQYVGSAYGANGIWGRWATSARNGHGGNRLLKGLMAKDTAYPAAFSYSILQNPAK